MGSRSRRQIRPRRAGRILPSRNAFKANRPCGKNSSTNGRRFCRRKNPIDQARWQELKRSEWLVILWVANARKIPTAVLDSVGQVYRQPIATIRDINLHFKITQKSKAIADESLVADIAPFVSCRCFTGLADLCRLKLMSFKPQGARRGKRIDTHLLPPSGFITTTVGLAVMSPTERDRKLITDLATQCP
jgi:hypothetical protein